MGELELTSAIAIKGRQPDLLENHSFRDTKAFSECYFLVTNYGSEEVTYFISSSVFSICKNVKFIVSIEDVSELMK